MVQELAIPEAEFDKMMEIYREHSQGGNELDPSVILEHVRDVRYALVKSSIYLYNRDSRLILLPARIPERDPRRASSLIPGLFGPASTFNFLASTFNFLPYT